MVVKELNLQPLQHDIYHQVYCSVRSQERLPAMLSATGGRVPVPARLRVGRTFQSRAGGQYQKVVATATRGHTRALVLQLHGNAHVCMLRVAFTVCSLQACPPSRRSVAKSSRCPPSWSITLFGRQAWAEVSCLCYCTCLQDGADVHV